MTEKSNTGQLFPAVIVFLLVIMAFLLGTLFQKVQILEKGGVVAANNAPQVANPNDTAPVAAEAAGEVEPVSDKDHVRGDRKAKIALIEYSDLECPFCQQFHATAQQVVDEYAGQVMWVYRHYPLSFHPEAKPRALGAECAAKLGGEDQFWAYIDKIFEVQGFTGTAASVATGLGISQNQFDTCIADAAIQAIIDEDVDLGTTAGVTGTPGNILLNVESGETKLIPGAVPFSQLKPVIDELLNS